ncbi:MAG: TIM barrel protein [Firmicutes bacterium]|nr:TIM barrel protein [Bacillota bacterium]
MLRIGPAGNSESFYAEGHQHTHEAAKWLHGMGLNAFEYSFGRGVNITPTAAAKIKQAFEQCDVQISAHAPYYINFANADAEMVKKSFDYVARSITAVQAFGGSRVVFHPAAAAGKDRGEALKLTLANIDLLLNFLDKEGLDNFILCAETMGKHNQIGSVDEIIEICKLGDCVYPCFDFGHINSFTGGGLKTKDDYRRILDNTFARLGSEKTADMHIHFSKIMYGKSGEIRHLDFTDDVFGPYYAPLAQLIDEYKMTPTVICESNGTMAEDAVTMKACHGRG